MTEELAKVSEAALSNEALVDWEERIGLDLRVGNTYNQYVTPDTIRRYAYGIGDANQLYSEEAYARESKYEALVASPAWVASVFPHWVLQGLAGVHADHSASDWFFYKPIYVGDKITPRCYFVGYDVKPSAFAGKTAFEYQRFEYWNQREELVSAGYNLLVRYERQTARGKSDAGEGKYDYITMPHPWTEEELEKVDEDVLAEEIRGANTRYWEDVNVGDEMQPVVKGPLGLLDMIAYTAGASPVLLAAHGVQLRNYRKHPAWAFRDPINKSWEPVYGVHYLNSAAKAVGALWAYDAGIQRHSWLVNLLTNWMSDEGWLKACNAQYRAFVYLSDAVWFTGKVSRKYVDENGEYCIDADVKGTNQRKEDCIIGNATVILPSKEARTSPVEKRLPAREYRGTGKGVYF